MGMTESARTFIHKIQRRKLEKMERFASMGIARIVQDQAKAPEKNAAIISTEGTEGVKDGNT